MDHPEEELDIKPVIVDLKIKLKPDKSSKKQPINRGAVCSFVACKNSRYDKFGNSNGFRFFSFPTRDLEQRKKWIHAVNRCDKDGKPWKPTRNTFICSAHFISGEYSRSNLDPDYVPTLLPGTTSRERKRQEIAKDRYQRMIQRKFAKIKMEPVDPDDVVQRVFSRLSSTPTAKSRQNIANRFACQTTEPVCNIAMTFTWSHERFPSRLRGRDDASTQACLPWNFSHSQVSGSILTLYFIFNQILSLRNLLSLNLKTMRQLIKMIWLNQRPIEQNMKRRRKKRKNLIRTLRQTTISSTKVPMSTIDLEVQKSQKQSEMIMVRKRLKTNWFVKSQHRGMSFTSNWNSINLLFQIFLLQ